MRQLDQLLGLLSLHARDGHLEVDRQADPAVLGRAEGDVRGDGRVRGVDALGLGPVGQRALEAGGVAGREQRLRVDRRLGRGARLRQVEVDQAVGAA